MTTSWEDRLREDLRELADVPGPDSPADRALTGARKLRRRRGMLVVAGPVALALLAFPVVTHLPSGLPFLGTGSGVRCESATTEADPPEKIPVREQPQFVRAFVAKLPPRDDYYLQSADGICARDGYPANGYAVINLGPYREHGHLTFTLTYETGPRTCEGMSAPPTVLCEEGTATTPFVQVREEEGNAFIVTVIQPDTRAVTIGAHQTPFDVTTLRAVAADPELAGLLP